MSFRFLCFSISFFSPLFSFFSCSVNCSVDQIVDYHLHAVNTACHNTCCRYSDICGNTYHVLIRGRICDKGDFNLNIFKISNLFYIT